MKPGVVVVAVTCALLLFGAGFWSRSLVSDVPTPAVTLPPPSLVAPAPLAVPSPGGPAMRPAPPPPPPEALAPAPTPAPSVNENGLRSDDPMLNKRVEAPPLQVPDDYQEDPNSPYAGKSRELEYAEVILHERKPDPVRLRSAHDVLQRCVQQEPDNERCQDDLAIAARLLRSVGMGPREAPPPKLDDPKMQFRKRGLTLP